MSYRKIIMVVILIAGFSCTGKQSKNTPGNDSTFQKEYNEQNKNEVTTKVGIKIIERLNNKIINYDIDTFTIKDVEIQEVNKELANERIQMIFHSSNYWKNNLQNYEGENLQLIKKYISHEDSTINFYKNFHGYRMTVDYITEIELVNKIRNYHRQVFFADTNANIVAESYPWKLKKIDTSSNLVIDSNSFIVIKKWWHDTLPKNLNNTVLIDYYDE